MKIEREWAMPSHHTFTIKPIRELLQRYKVGKNINLKYIIGVLNGH